MHAGARAVTAPGPPLVIGCGVLGRELRWLAAQRGWALELKLLDPMLHIEPPRLAREVCHELELARGRDVSLFYGACHPSMDRWAARHAAPRAAGACCFEMLLGPARYAHELERGSFFLVEALLPRWRQALELTFGARPWLVKEVFKSHQQLLALRTPCSQDYRAEAEAAAASVGLPLEWADVELGHLEAVLAPLVARGRGA